MKMVVMVMTRVRVIAAALLTLTGLVFGGRGGRVVECKTMRHAVVAGVGVVRVAV